MSDPREEPSPPAASEPTDAIRRLGPWFHNLHLPDGSQTFPDHHFGDFPAWKWRQFEAALPADLEGWTALDIGCNAGFYTVELARRGARVHGIDISTHYLRQARWACEAWGVGDRVTLERVGVYELGRMEQTWDLVLFLGVLYHLRYPLLGLDVVARRARRLVVVQSLVHPEGAPDPRYEHDFDFQHLDRVRAPGWPRMAFVKGSFCRDPTNWWIPSAPGLRAMVESAGLEVLASPAPDILVCHPTGRGPDSEWCPDYGAVFG